TAIATSIQITGVSTRAAGESTAETSSAAPTGMRNTATARACATRSAFAGARDGRAATAARYTATARCTAAARSPCVALCELVGVTAAPQREREDTVDRRAKHARIRSKIRAQRWRAPGCRDHGFSGRACRL